MFSRLFPPRTPNVSRRTEYYRVRSGRTDYGFSFEQQAGGGWRVYITLQPVYGRRATGCHETHRYSDQGRHYICWTGTISSITQAREVAKMWAEKTERYILYGERF